MLEKLLQLGFNKKEAKVYLILLELGAPSPASTVAKRAKMNRTTAYYILENLVEKGLVIRSQRDQTYYFQSQTPEHIIQYLENKSKKLNRQIKDAQSLLPELRSRHNPSEKTRPRVYFFEGLEGVLRVYEETLTTSDEITAYASAHPHMELLSWYFPEYYKRRTGRGIRARALFPDTENDWIRHSFDEEEIRESRILPKEMMDFTTEINFFDDRMMIADWDDKLGIIIESREIVKVFKQAFELAWEAAEKYHIEIKAQRKKDGKIC